MVSKKFSKFKEALYNNFEVILIIIGVVLLIIYCILPETPSMYTYYINGQAFDYGYQCKERYGSLLCYAEDGTLLKVDAYNKMPEFKDERR